MKLNCCCFWCYCCDDHNKDQEQSKLLKNDHIATTSNVKSPVKAASFSVRQAPSLSSCSATEDIGSEKNVAKKGVTKSLDGNEKEKEEKKKRVMGKIRKMRLVSQLTRIKSCALLDHRPLALNIDLKVDIKVFPTSNTIKLFAVGAYGVSKSALKEEDGSTQEGNSPTEQDQITLQLRTKITPSETRGHSKKYTLKENVLDSVKFCNENLHCFTIGELKESTIRFRLYQLFKQRRDRLLGEYNMILNDLDINVIESGTSSVSMRLHDVDENNKKEAPKVKKYQSQNSLNSPVGSTKSKSKKSTLRSLSSSDTFRGRFLSSNSDSGKDDMTSSTVLPSAASTENFDKKLVESSQSGSFKALHNAFRERLDRVSELEEQTTQMTEKAVNFSDVSRRLTEKYRQKAGK